MATRRRWLRAGLLLACMAALLVTWTGGAPAFSRSALELRSTLELGGGSTIFMGEHSLAVGSDGSLWAWGINSYGAIGDGTTEEHLVPVRVGTGSDWAAVAGGAGFSLALKTDGTLWAWGTNRAGQLGDGTTNDRQAPAQVASDTDWAFVAGGSDHSLAIKTDGSLWAWGANDRGQLGDGTTVARTAPTRVGTRTDWVAVAGGSDFSLALAADGTLWAWGSNHDGQLGDGTTTDRHLPTSVGSDADWVALSSGASFCLALKSDGTLWTWGANRYGQLGDGSTVDRSMPAQVGAEAEWMAIAGGSDHSLAIKTDGSLWAWGNNVKGEVGDGTTDERHTPVLIGSGTAWKAVAAGGFGATNGGVSMALRADGSLHAWGYGRHGEVGDGLRENRVTPFEILRGVKLPAGASGGGMKFSDVGADDPYCGAITAMAAAGAIGGYPDGTFRPGNAVTRGQFAKMIVGAMKLPVAETDWQDGTRPFTDCGPDDPADLYPHDYIAVAKAQGLTTGKTATTFAPGASITRAQMVTMVVRAAESSGVALAPVGADYAGPFKAYVEPVHGANVHLADRNGLLWGLVATADPGVWMRGNATRGEVAQVLANLMGLRPE